TETYIAYVAQTVAGKLVSTTNVDSIGVVYIPDTIRAISGDLNGHLTVVTESNAMVTRHLRYVDNENDYAYLNGSPPASGEFLPNPKFNRNHALGIIAKGDVRYALTAP